LNILVIGLLIVLVTCLGSGCRLTEPGEPAITPTATAVEIIAEQTTTPPRATATGAVAEGETESMPDNNMRVARPGVPFKIGFGETVRLGNFPAAITFAAIIQDGRCPVAGACLWEGVGEIQFGLAGEGAEKKEFILSIPGLVETPYTSNSFIEVGGFHFKLLQLDPYPSGEAPAQPDAYQAQLLFEERQ
jgi:hypothetical protein